MDEFVSETWAKAHLAHLAASAQILYADTYYRHISPHLGSLQLRNIRPETVAHWQAELVENEVGKKR